MVEKNKKVKDWYLEAFPKAQLGKEINSDVTFKQLYEMLLEREAIYNYIGNDSVVRKGFLKSWRKYIIPILKQYMNFGCTVTPTMFGKKNNNYDF